MTPQEDITLHTENTIKINIHIGMNKKAQNQTTKNNNNNNNNQFTWRDFF